MNFKKEISFISWILLFKHGTYFCQVFLTTGSIKAVSAVIFEVFTLNLNKILKKWKSENLNIFSSPVRKYRKSYSSYTSFHFASQFPKDTRQHTLFLRSASSKVPLKANWLTLLALSVTKIKITVLTIGFLWHKIRTVC